MLFLPFLLGGFTGMRTCAPLAIICCLAYFHRIPMTGWRIWTGAAPVAFLFALGAVGELIGDKLPQTPPRLNPLGLVSRIVFGAACGIALEPFIGVGTVVSAICGALGAVAGAYAGWYVRTNSVAALRCPDWPVALAEDCVCIGGSIAVLLAIMHLD